MGQPLELDFSVGNAVSSANQDYVLAVSADEEKAAYLIDTAPGRFGVRKLTEAPGAVSRIVMSPNGSAVAFFYEGSRKLIVLGNMPNRPEPKREIDLSGYDALPGAISLSDDASAVVVAFPDQEKVIWFDEPDKSYPLSETGPVTAARFLTKSREAVLANTRDNKILLVRDGAVLPVAGETEGISVPVAVGATPDNKRLIVVNSSSASIAEFDLSTGGLFRSTSCQCAPVELERMTGNYVFRLNEPVPGTPLWLLETGPDETRILFVPPDAEN